MTNRLVKLTVAALVALALGGGLFVGTAGALPPPSVFAPSPPLPPRNDQFVNAMVLSPNPTVFNVSPAAGDIRNATAERGEPNHAGFAGVSAYQSVWFQWRAPRNGLVEFDTCNSHFDTELGVYTGNVVSALTPIAQDDDDNVRPPGTDNKCGTTFPLYYNSQVEFQAVAGTTYRIAVDGYFPGVFYNNSAFFLNYRYLAN